MNHCGSMMIVCKVLVGKKYPKFVASFFNVIHFQHLFLQSYMD
jgi:hypothetical protein